MSVKCFEVLGGGREVNCQVSLTPPRWRTLGQVGALYSGPGTSALHLLSHLGQGLLGDPNPTDCLRWC